jgi:hypothetical protein
LEFFEKKKSQESLKSQIVIWNLSFEAFNLLTNGVVPPEVGHSSDG